MEKTGESKRKIKIKSLDEQVMEYDLDYKSTIGQLKDRISQETSISRDKIRLIYLAKCLEDSRIIGEVAKEDGVTFHLVARLQTNPTPPPPTRNPNPQNNRTQNQQQGQMPQNNPFSGLLNDIQNMINNPNSNMGQMDVNVQIADISNLNPQNPNPTNTNLNPNNPNNAQPNNMPNMPGMNFQNVFTNLNSMMNNMNPPNFQNPSTPQNPQNNNQTGQNTNQTRNVNPQQNQPQNNSNNRDIPLTPEFERQVSGQWNQNNPQRDIPLNPQFQPTRTNQTQNQNQQRPPTNMRYVSNNPQRNNVRSVNNQGILLSFNNDNAQTEEHVLNTQNLRNIRDIMGQTSRIDVRINEQRRENSASMTGMYLTRLHHNLYNFLPFLDTAADILKNEQILRNPNQRQQYNSYIRNIGKILKEYKKCFENLEFLERLNLNDSPSNFHLQHLQSQQQQNNTISEEEQERRNIERDRNSINNMRNILSQGVNLNSTTEDLTRHVGMNEGSGDFWTMIMMDLNMADLMKFINGDSTIINQYKSKIKFRFQNLLLKNQNNREKMVDDLMGETTSNSIKAFSTEEGNKKLYEGFDAKLVIKEIAEEFYEKFKTLLLKDYPENSPATFSQEYMEVIKKFYGKLAYEVSEGLINGIDAFEITIKTTIKKYVDERLGDIMPLTDQMFDSLIWKHWATVLEYYQKHKKMAENKQSEKKLLKKLKELKELDAKVSKQPQLSEAYIKGKAFKN